jgi:hypothetical protein
MKGLYSLLLLLAATLQVAAANEPTPNKTDALGRRLAAYNDEYYNPVTGWWDYDSVTYTYSSLTGTYSQEILNRHYDTITDTYHDYSRMIYFFEDFVWKGNIRFTLNGAIWDTSARELYTYNGADQMAQSTYEAYSAGTWTMIARTTYTYDQGRLASKTSEYISGGALDFTNRDLYTYDSQGHLTELRSQSWTSGAWVDSGRNTYQNDASGNALLATYSAWDGTNWNDQNRRTSTYTSANKIHTQIYEQNNAGTWTNYSRTTNVYYAANNEDSLLLYESWVANAWDTTTMVESVWLDSTTKLVAAYSWDGAEWDSSNRTFYYYILGEVSGLGEMATAQEVKVYPNPASEMTTLNITANKEEAITISLFNISGQQLLELHQPTVQGANQIRVDTHTLPSGFYTYVIHSATGKRTGKLVIQK